MRVLHLGKFYPPYHGGIESYTAALAQSLAENEVQIAVLAHAPPGTHRTQTQLIKRVEVTLAACYGQLLYTPISPSLPVLLHRIIRRFRPDVLHLHMPNPAAFFTLLSPLARRLPWVIHWHSDVPLQTRDARVRLAYRLYRPWEQALLRRAQAIIATSVAYRDSSAALSTWRNKVHVIPLGLAAATVPPTSTVAWPAPGLRLLSVGRLTYYKGFDVLLRALAQVPQASLLLVGDGECESGLKQLSNDLGIEARVHFAGSLNETQLLTAYAQADAFCLSSIERSEAFGLVLLEAMRARLPVIASAIPGSGVGYVVESGKTGYLVPPNDSTTLAKTIISLVQDADLRRRFGEAGHIRWSQEFSLEQVTQQTLTLYRSLLHQDQHHATTTPIK